MKVLVTYLLDEKNLELVAHIPCIEFDVDTGSIFVDRDLPPRLSLKLKELATQLAAFYLDMEDVKETEK